MLFAAITGNAQSSCSSALSIGLGTYTVSSITGTSPSSSCGTPSGTNGIWYKFIPTQNGLATVSTVIPGQNVDTQVRVYAGTCAFGSCIVANDNFSGTSAQVSFIAEIGRSYYIAFDNLHSSSGFNFVLSQEVRATNLTFTSQNISGLGVYSNCVVDMNGDYLDDIVSVSNSSQLSIAYQKATGGFNNINYSVSSVGITPSWSIAAGDYDGNGYNDLMYGSGSGIAFLKANSTGTGFIPDRKPQSFLTQRTNFVDINNDGKLDAFACDDNAPNRYYLNDGTSMNHNQGGIGDFPSGGNYGSNWIDYDNDGDMDVYIAKCSGGGSGPGGNIDELFRNNGNGVFTSVGPLTNMDNATQTWSAAWGDFNNDGWVDAVVGINSTTDGLSKVMKNNGGIGIFTDVTSGSGYDTTNSLSREYVAYDFDNDGFLDVLGAASTIMFGNGNFQFMPNPTSYNLDYYERPVGDLNNDGFLDIQNGNLILINNGNSNKWLKIALQGVESNRNGIGARIIINGSWGKQIRDVQSGTGFGNMSTLNTHFGIGQATTISSVVINWPSGTVDTLYDVTPNTTLFVKEGSTLGTSETKQNQELFTIYPNPVEQIIYFQTKKDFVPNKAKLQDASGRIILQKELTKNEITVHHLKAGLYFLTLKDKNGKEHTQKLIKK